MKVELTREQSTHLIELGVSADKATKFAGLWEIKDGKPIVLSRFTLTDVMKLLPKEIYSEEREIFYYLTMTMGAHTSNASYKHAGYTKGFGPTKYEKELIDALYELLVWTIKNKYYQQ